MYESGSFLNWVASSLPYWSAMETFIYIYSTLNGRVDLNDYRIKLYGAEFKPIYKIYSFYHAFGKIPQ